MLRRKRAGGIAFWRDEVLMIRTETHEWLFPRASVGSDGCAEAVALDAVRAASGVEPRILADAGNTSYEHYSVQRQRRVHNEIQWYVMVLQEAPEQGASAHGDAARERVLSPIDAALETLTFDQDKSLLMMAYQRYRELCPLT